VLDDGATAPEVGDGHSLVWCEPPTMALDPIVQMMGGRIWVVSTPGQGSAFHFTSSFGVPIHRDDELQAIGHARLTSGSTPVVIASIPPIRTAVSYDHSSRGPSMMIGVRSSA